MLYSEGLGFDNRLLFYREKRSQIIKIVKIGFLFALKNGERNGDHIIVVTISFKKKI